MSLDSEDAELSRLQRAAAFMQEVRLAQSKTEKKFIGRNRISAEQKRAITQATENSALVAAVKESAHIDLPVNNLAERFEEMCRRQGATVDAQLRPSVVKLLAVELWVNHIALGARAETLTSATLHRGAIAPELLKEFSEYPAYAITSAMLTHPATSREFLHRVGVEIAKVSADPEFRLIAEKRPYEFLNTALLYATDVPTQLRKIVREATEKGRGWTK